MKVTARRKGGDREEDCFVHEVAIEGGHTIVVDEPVAAGGADAGPSPTRLLAASLASCVAITMEMYAKRKGWAIGAVEVDVDVQYEGAVPISFAVFLRLPEELSEEQRQRLLAVARKCPVHKAIGDETPVAVSDQVGGL